LALWPMFGAVNQLLAALALLIVSLYLKRRSAWAYWLTLLPCLFMLIVTGWALIFQQQGFLAKKNWLLVAINGVTLLLTAWLLIEAAMVLFRPAKKAEAPVR